jgi:ABC-type transporter Mla MlaB component
MTSVRSKVAMSNGRRVLTGDLDVDERLAFLSAMQLMVDSGNAPVEVDCSAVMSVEAVDDAVIGMLVTLARAAQRRGERVALLRAPKAMRAQMEIADVAHFFDWA